MRLTGCFNLYNISLLLYKIKHPSKAQTGGAVEAKLARNEHPSRYAALLATLALCGCANLGYYAHLGQGQYQLLRQRESIDAVIADASRDPGLRAKLEKLRAARVFASQQLALPDNRSYTQYADLQRPYALWNVFATPELSLAPVTHCFLFSGCLAYRGYFDEAQARAKARELEAQGYETFVAGVPAYSTLGWFNDPVLNSMMHWSDETLIGTLFHELAHQKFYLKNDSAFSESLANFVEAEGLRQYLQARHENSAAHEQDQRRAREFVQLILAARTRLAAIYLRAAPAAQLRELKQQEFARLYTDYQTLRNQTWGGYPGYDRWFEGKLNNAKLLPFGLYDEYVPAFAALYASAQKNWPEFYRAVEALAQQPPAQRNEILQTLRDTTP